jgi:hypothetical protein
MIMKRTFVATTAGILAASILATPVLAQVGVGASGNASGGVGVGAEAGGVGVGAEASGSTSGAASAGSGSGIGVDAGTTAATGAQADVGQAVSSIQTSRTAAAEIAAVTDASSVNVVNIGALAEGQNGDALETAMAENADGIVALRSAVGSNAALSSALESQGIDVAAVVGATANADGSVTVYTQ